MTISACIICFNEENNIERCLSSVAWADEIVVVDSMSLDRTVEIARGFTDSVYQRRWTGYVDQKNFALSKSTGDWVLSVDADEEVPDSLRQEIIREINKKDAGCGYSMPRRSFYQGRWINHSGFYPDRQLRLFRRDKAEWVGSRVHERVEIHGPIGELKNDLLHYPYKGVVSGQIRTVDNFSGLLAENLLEKGARYSVWLLIIRPVFKFLEVYLLKLGFLDGSAGLIIAVTSSYAMFVRYVKLRELERAMSKKELI